MIACRRDTVSASTLAQSGLKQTLDLSYEGIEGELLGSGACRDLLRVLALSLREQLTHHPRPRARIAKPVDVETRGELLVQYGLQLPRSQVPRRVVSRIDINEGIGSVVLEPRGTGEKRYVKIGQRLPRHLATVQRMLINELGAVPSQKMQLLEAGRAQEFVDSVGAQLRVAEEPAAVLHAMIEQHRIRFGNRVVSKPAEFERVIGAGITEVESVTELVQESVVVTLAAVGPQHQVHFLRDPHRRAERPRPLALALTDVEDDSSAGSRIDAHLRNLAAHHIFHLAAGEGVVVLRRAKDR